MCSSDLTFKMKQNNVEAGPEDSAEKIEDVTGPIA